MPASTGCAPCPMSAPGPRSTRAKACRCWPLPSSPFELAEWRSGKVNLDYHVEFEARYYSVPHQLVHEPVHVRATAQVVEILHRHRRVTSHVREYGKRRFITKPEH